MRGAARSKVALAKPHDLPDDVVRLHRQEQEGAEARDVVQVIKANDGKLSVEPCSATTIGRQRLKRPSRWLGADRQASSEPPVSGLSSPETQASGARRTYQNSARNCLRFRNRPDDPDAWVTEIAKLADLTLAVRIGQDDEPESRDNKGPIDDVVNVLVAEAGTRSAVQPGEGRDVRCPELCSAGH